MNINIGGTKNWKTVPGQIRKQWKILDIAGRPDYSHDLNSEESLPFDDDSISNFYCSHTLEHVRHWLVVPLLKDMLRCLKPSGHIRIVVPNFLVYLDAFIRRDDKWQKKTYRKLTHRKLYPDTHLGVLMGLFYSYVKSGKRNGHHMTFDWETLYWCVKKAGFQDIRKSYYNKGFVQFVGLEFSRHKKTSLYLEAVK